MPIYLKTYGMGKLPRKVTYQTNSERNRTLNNPTGIKYSESD